MGSTQLLRKGLSNWDAVKDNAQGSGLDASIDIPGDKTFNDTEQSGTIEFLSHAMRLEPRSQEAGVIDKLNKQIDELMAQNYGDIDKAVEQFFEKVEQPSKAEPAELEYVILSVQKVIYLATETVAQLYQDAYFADRVQQDEYWAAYKGMQKEKDTAGNRQAFAYESSRDARFFYYYSYLIWRRVSEKLSALKDLQKSLEWYRSRSLKDKSW